MYACRTADQELERGHRDEREEREDAERDLKMPLSWWMTSSLVMIAKIASST